MNQYDIKKLVINMYVRGEIPVKKLLGQTVLVTKEKSGFYSAFPRYATNQMSKGIERSVQVVVS